MLDKKNIQKNFSRGAKNYDELAAVQAIAAAELVKMVRGGGPTILDLGSGTSFIAKEILKQVQDDGGWVHDDVKIYEVDLSAEMLKSWVDRPANVFPIQGDIENLPFEKNSFDLIISSFSLQWISDFEKTFSQIFSLLKPNGIFAFCLPTDGSLQELKASNIFNLNDLPKVEDLKSYLKKSGFLEKNFVAKIIKQEFTTGFEALKSLKKIGANSSAKEKKIITKTELKQFDIFCLKNSNTNNRRITVSWSLSFFITTKHA